MTLVTDTKTYRSPNYDLRPGGIDSIVLHTTDGVWPSDAKWLCNPQKSKKYDPVSCHYVIAPSGAIYQLVDEDKRAWHAGSGTYLGISDWNDASIGIEVSVAPGKSWDARQLLALTELCSYLIDRYSIRQSMIVAHRWIAPDRRTDPARWPDANMRLWIDGLYEPAEPDWERLWGKDFPYRHDWGIPARWREEHIRWRGLHIAGTPLGRALSDEEPFNGGVIQLFEKGIITYRDGGIQVYRGEF